MGGWSREELLLGKPLSQVEHSRGDSDIAHTALAFNKVD
jgi:hypothetical protein